ncbi:DUF1120 domain-containing protein [Pantoea brenneri]|uniref:DUF1120 domain-containing protein n=1 Tax=Pantoea brenneri TaxID=472694 RepID=UPI00289A03B3|nr:DUF1120 domain-containing protein [Pantoea brenneri]
MRKLLINSALLMAVTTASFSGLAAESATLSVTGTINPAACDVSLSSSSIALGFITASSLKQAMNTKTGNDITLNVDCDAAAAIAVQTTDNRASTAMTVAEISDELQTSLPEMTDANIFGLGADTANNKIGVLLLGITAATKDGVANSNLLSSTDKSSWTAKSASPSSIVSLAKNGYFALAADSSSTIPVAATKETYNIYSGIMLKKSDKYPSGEAVELDGNVTFSVVYL